MKKFIYILFIMVLLFDKSSLSSDTNYILGLNMQNGSWSNFYLLDTERLFLNGQEIFGTTSGVFQVWVNGTNFYGDIYFQGAVSALNSSTLVFNASSFTQSYSVIFSDSATQSVAVSLGASNTIFVSNGTNSSPSFVSLTGLGFATGTPSYVDLGATGFVGDARLTLSYNPSTRIATGSVSVLGLATGTPLYVETSLTNGISQGQTANIAITNNGRQFYLTSSGFATGTPLYVDIGLTNGILQTVSGLTSGSTLTNSANQQFYLTLNLADTNHNIGISGGSFAVTLSDYQGAVAIGGYGPGGVASGALDDYSVAIGGYNLQIYEGESEYSVGIGGNNNEVASSNCVVIGGNPNKILDSIAYNSVIIGGYSNIIRKHDSVAFGSKTLTTNEGCFMWGDSSSGDISSTRSNQFVIKTQDMFVTGLISTVDFYFNNLLVFATPTNAVADNTILSGSGVANTKWSTAAQLGLATGTPLYVETDSLSVLLTGNQEMTGVLTNKVNFTGNGSGLTNLITILSNSTVVGTAKKINFVNPSLLTIAGGTASVTTATGGTGGGTITNNVYGGNALVWWGRAGNLGVVNKAGTPDTRAYLAFDSAATETTGVQTIFIPSTLTNFNFKVQWYSLDAALTTRVFFAYRSGGQAAFTLLTNATPWSGSGFQTQWVNQVYSFSQEAMAGVPIDCYWGLYGTNNFGIRTSDTWVANAWLEAYK